MITGGYGSGRDTAEVWQPGLGAPCSLPDMPEDRRDHTQEGGDICGGEGGENTFTNCIRWSNNTWMTTNSTLIDKRGGHSSWRTEDGSLILMGGGYGSRSSEVVNTDGISEQSFTLKFHAE